MTNFSTTFKDSYCQTFDDTGKNRRELVRTMPMSDFNKETLTALNKAGAGIFFTPNPCKGGRKEENVTSIDWVYVDMDNGTKAEMRAKIESAPIRPHIIIESKRSYHIYWKVGMMDRDDFDNITKGLIEFFDGDPAISSINEVLRVPEFNHMKDPTEPFEIRTVYFKIEPVIAPQMLEEYPHSPEVIKTPPQATPTSCVDDRVVDNIKDIPIIQVLESLGVEINRNNFIVQNGEVTSASINVEGNYINRFSGKEGSGSNIDAVMAYGNMTMPEAIKYLKRLGGIKDVERIVSQSKKLETVDKIDEIEDNPFTWGTKELDKIISPIERNHYIVFAGETASGKSAFCFDMATKNAKLGHKVLYLTLEMSTDGVYTRVAREYAGITKEKWRDKTLISDIQREQYKRKKAELKNLENLILIGVTDNPPIDKIHEIIKQVNPDLVYIDNFDKIGIDKTLSEVGAQTEISAKILAICEDTPIPIVLIHHLKKGEDKDLNKPRNINSLRGSGKIGHDAYTVVLGFRAPFKDGMTKEELSKFTLIEIKDREFGIGGFHSCYFDKGTFNDKPKAEIMINDARDVFGLNN